MAHLYGYFENGRWHYTTDKDLYEKKTGNTSNTTNKRQNTQNNNSGNDWQKFWQHFKAHHRGWDEKGARANFQKVAEEFGKSQDKSWGKFKQIFKKHHPTWDDTSIMDNFYRVWQGITGNKDKDGGGSESISGEWGAISGALKSAQETYRRLAEAQLKKLQQQLAQQEWLFQHYKGLIPDYESKVNEALGLLGNIQTEYADVVNAYKQGVHAAITGEIPPEIKNKLEAIRQSYINQGRGSLRDYYNQIERRYMDTLASKGILQSKPAADILANLRKEELNKIADQVNKANMLYAQQSLNEPYRALQAIGSEGPMVLNKTKIPLTKVSTALAKLKPSSTLSGLLAQASQYPMKIASIGQSMEQLPMQNIQYETAKTDAYTRMIQPLLSMWQTQQQMDLAKAQQNAQEEASMWGAFGSIVPFIFGGGLFG